MNWNFSHFQDKTIRLARTPVCMTMSNDGKDMVVEDCTGADNQIWEWEIANLTKPHNQ